MASSEELKSGALSAGRSAALWLLSTAFILLLSASLISHAFVQKFFEPQLYLDSLERHGLYSQMQQGIIETFTSRMPSEVRPSVSAAVSRAVTYEYARGEASRLITNFLDFLSARKPTLELVLDLSPITREFASSTDPQVKLLAPEMPSGLDFGAQLRQSGQMARLESFRSQISQAGAANAMAIAISVLLLAPVFLLHPDWEQGLAKCLALVASAGVSTLIGGAIFAFLAPAGLPSLLGVASSSEGIANAVSLVMGDVIKEIGILVMAYSLPLLAIGYGLPYFLRLQPAAPSAQQPAPPTQKPPVSPPAE